ncbi:hypothetical protein [Burkholderia sp. Tr-20355]|uniref:hypothetical protein n=1 Tax=Burkholderia sp. Tr-20355 TaxID=2703895 RepID=UPI00197E17F9|nr:hypothetical protein [Burkholderia sp. Tr-20355]MBN3738078.1 hypothetical protein [Burkholderia sp. Tr-20355]
MSTRIKQSTAFLVDDNGRLVGYVDENGRERELNGAFITPGGTPTRANYVLASSSASSSVTGTTSEATLATAQIPANTLASPGARLRVTLSVTCTNNANAKTLRARLAAVQALQLSSSFSNVTGGRVYFDIVATSSAAQKCMSGVASYSTAAGAAVTAMAVDMTQAQSLTLTAQLATSTDTFQLEEYTVEILRP